MRSLSLVVLTVLAALSGGRLIAQQDPASPFPRARPGWEYKALYRGEVEDWATRQAGDRFAAGLSRLASYDWELVGVDPEAPGREAMYLFGRPRSSGGPTVGGGMRVVRLRNADAASLAQTLAAVFPDTDVRRVRFIPDQRTNSLIVVAAPGMMPVVLKLIGPLDRPLGETPPAGRP